MFLVRIDKDLRLQKIVKRPIEVYSFDEGGNVADVELIEKTDIVCDACGIQALALTEDDLESGLSIGYAVCDEGYVYEVVCEECRKRYFRGLKIYNDLDEAGDV